MPRKRKLLSDFLNKYYELINTSEDKEIWKNIEIGDEPLYQISNHGRVRNKNGLIINPFHSYRKDSNGNFRFDRPTYLRVQIYYYENGIRKKKHCEISRLVAKAFIPIPEKYLKMGLNEDDLEVNHIKGGYEIYNNFVSNLEWCTTKENVHHSIITNLRPEKHNMSNSLVNDNDVIDICKCIENNLGVVDSYNGLDFVKSKNIPYEKFKILYYNIKYKKCWKYISQHFNF